MLSPCKANLEEPEGFQVEKDKQNKPEQEVAKFANITSDTKSSEDEFPFKLEE